MGWTPVHNALTKRMNQHGFGEAISAQQLLDEAVRLFPVPSEAISYRNGTLKLAIKAEDMMQARLEKHALLAKLQPWCAERRLSPPARIVLSLQQEETTVYQVKVIDK